ncbi:MAG: hypothetical protein FWC39_05480 [Bacteroidetes bacterium]|nr:hypothetical protein [Bacteroidota bacterium]
MNNHTSISNFLLKGNPVISLSGNEFAKKEGYTLTLKEKLLDVVNQEVISDSPLGSSNPTLSLATNQGDIANVLQNILFTK